MNNIGQLKTSQVSRRDLVLTPHTVTFAAAWPGHVDPALERRVVAGVRELGCAVLQHAVDARAGAEVRLAQVTGADGVARPRAGRGARTIVTVLGPVRVRRIGYRARVKGARALFPADAVLNLPPRRCSWGLQQLAVPFTQAVSYEQARRFVRAATGISIGKRQLEQITAKAAAAAAGFEPSLPPEQAGPLALSPDAKGVGGGRGVGTVVRPRAISCSWIIEVVQFPVAYAWNAQVTCGERSGPLPRCESRGPARHAYGR